MEEGECTGMLLKGICLNHISSTIMGSGKDLFGPYLFILVTNLLYRMTMGANANKLLIHPLVDNRSCPII